MATRYKRFKRIFDFIFAIFSILLLSPLLVLILILVRANIGKPVFFRQVRPGLYGIPFKILKFRSMTNECDQNGNFLPNKDRINNFGKFLRSFSLDELPELFNVLRGEMSVVGPRPLLVCYLDRYTDEQSHRHDVRPGITGWAQVNGRNNMRWEDKFSCDIWYVSNQSFSLDLKILIKTIKNVLQRNGVNAEGFIGASEFRGSN